MLVLDKLFLHSMNGKRHTAFLLVIAGQSLICKNKVFSTLMNHRLIMSMALPALSFNKEIFAECADYSDYC